MASFKGLLNSVFRRRQKSVIETLEDIDANIELLKEHKESKVSSANKITFQLIFYASIPYVTFLVVYFFLLRPTETHWRVISIVGVFLYPIIVLFLKYLVNTIYLGSASRADKKLKDLLKQKRQILENVMNTETYNKAQQILKQFDPLGLIVRDFSIDRPIPKTEFETTARQRNVPNNKNAPCTPKPVPRSSKSPPFFLKPSFGSFLLPHSFRSFTVDAATQIPTCQNPTTTTPTPTPSQPLKGPITHRPILPRERSILDIVVDAIVGDGPDRRYALICQNCSGHNGMALAEEFEYLAFRCCYCGFHNPARRNRRHPQALKFPTSPDSPFNQPTPLSASYERPQYSSALNLTSVGSRSHLNRGPFERISASTENVLSSSFIESSALPPRSSKRCRTVAATQRNPASRSASACSLTTSPLLPEEESEKDPSEKSEEGES
ncbi:unnamed protein product [Hymenolepis diminuta]|uniref:Endoplasmic reticulum junction formation protein lunapark n=1 Tax=Hymenolepis diminuta TaxID=6216 RepID=A0A564YQ49_HYMDI|nr:unnamed protein product [Hymenolepis diminuta]